MIGLTTQSSSKTMKPILNISESLAIEKARKLTTTDIDQLSQKEFLSIEESQMLLLRMIDEEYDRP